MGKKKKPARELTTEEIAKRVFPAKVVRELKKEAHKHDDDGNGKKKEAKKSK